MVGDRPTFPSGIDPFLYLRRSFREANSCSVFQARTRRSLGREGLVWPGSGRAPGHAHGGSMAAVLDEALGAAAWMSGHPVVAARLVTVFRRMLPLGTSCFLEAQVSSVERKKLSASGRIMSSTGEVAEAEGHFC